MPVPLFRLVITWVGFDNVESVEIDPVTLSRAGPYCAETTEEVFITGTAPAEYCPLHSAPGFVTNSVFE